MKTILLRSIIFLLGFLVVLPFVNAQDKPTSNSNFGSVAYVQPENPSPVDSVRVFYKYVSSDGCPDYYLAIDSVVDAKIYVSRKNVENPPQVCNMIVKTFVISVNLGVLDESSEIYFNEKLIKTINYRCFLNRIGLVVPGIDGCTGELFIRELSVVSTSPRLYRIAEPKNGDTLTLNAGDQVKFGAYMVKRDSMSILCPVVGVATCFELIVPLNTYSLYGNAKAGEDLVLAGKAMLIKKGNHKTWAFSTIYNGKYAFANVPEGEYTVLVVPDRPQYRYFMPTFYIDKLRLSEADYVTLNQDISDLTVVLKQVQIKTGHGKIHGKATYEHEGLRDSLMNERGTNPDKRVANGIPVMLLNNKNEAIAWAVTDVDGDYSFDGVAPDNYRVVAESASAVGEIDANLNTATDVNADIILKSPEQATSVNNPMLNQLQVYPNPATEILYINLKEAGNVQIFNAVGQVLLNQFMNQGIQELDVKNFQQGILLVKTKQGNFKVVKR